MSEVRSVHIYVDGSCSENRNVTAETRAGWGLCVIVNDGGSGNGKGHLFTELYGEVITNQDEGASWEPKWGRTTRQSCLQLHTP